MKIIKAILILMSCAQGSLWADVIYLKNGSVLIVDRAWEDGGEIKYKSAADTRSIPQSAVQRIQHQKAMPADPSRNQATQVEIIRGTPGVAAGPADNRPADNRSIAPPDRKKARSSRYQDLSGFREAQRLQQSSDKPIALYFYTDWCPYCARFERNVLSHPDVQRYLSEILYVSVNPEHGEGEKELFSSFDGDGYPTFLMIRKDQQAAELSTSGPPSEFVRSCKQKAGGAASK